MVAEGICARCAWNPCINACFPLEQTIHLKDENTHSYTVQKTHDFISFVEHKKNISKYRLSSCNESNWDGDWYPI